MLLSVEVVGPAAVVPEALGGCVTEGTFGGLIPSVLIGACTVVGGVCTCVGGAWTDVGWETGGADAVGRACGGGTATVGMGRMEVTGNPSCSTLARPLVNGEGGALRDADPLAETLAARQVWAWEHMHAVMTLGAWGEKDSWVANPAEGQHPDVP